jgi:predicted nucleic acid-binding protein
MSAAVFLDTNIFLYAIDEDPASAEKRSRAREILLEQSWCWSVQIAAEFFVNATSMKRPFRLAVPAAAALVETWLAFPTADITAETVRSAIAIQVRYGLNYWDAAVIASAKNFGCQTVISEDLNSGQDYDGIRVVNPFTTSATQTSS